MKSGASSPTFVARILDRATSLANDITPKTWHEKQGVVPAPIDSGFGYVQTPYNSMFNVQWGVAPSADLAKYRQMYRTVPIIKQALDKTVSSAINVGFKKFKYANNIQVKNGDKIIEYLNDWISKQEDWRTTLLVIGGDMLLYGNAFVEVIYSERNEHVLEAKDPKNGIPERAVISNENMDWACKGLSSVENETITKKTSETVRECGAAGVPVRLKPLDPLYMRVRGDAYGNVFGYIQWLSAPPVAFTAEKIGHFKFNPKSTVYESFYGTSKLQSMVRTQECIWQIENDNILVGHAAVKPPVHFACGSSDADDSGKWTDKIFDKFKQQMAGRGPGGDIFSRGDIKVTPLPSPTAQLGHMMKNLEYHSTQRTIALGVPPQLLGQPEGSSRTTAEVSLDDWVNTLQILQMEIGNVLKEQIFKYVVEARFGKDTPVPDVIWNGLFDRNVNDEVSRIVSLKSAGIISINEARALAKDLGFELPAIEGADFLPELIELEQAAEAEEEVEDEEVEEEEVEEEE